ncbi:MAG: hypothetical protein AAF715_20815 [Myxococcota bacterium]
MFRRVISSAQLSKRLVDCIAEVLTPYDEAERAREIVRRALSAVGPSFDADDPVQLQLFAGGALADAASRVLPPPVVDEVVAEVMTLPAQKDATAGGFGQRRDADTAPDGRPPRAVLSAASAASGAPSPPAEARPLPRSLRASSVGRQPLALVITDDVSLFAAVMRTLEREQILCFECGPDPLEVVSEARALDAAFIVYDAAALPDGAPPGALFSSVHRALGPDTPHAVVLVADHVRPPTVEHPGWLGAVAKGRVEREIAEALRRVAKERKGSPDPPALAPRRHPSMPQGVASSAALPRRGRRTFDHVLGEALGSVASDRILEVVLDNALATARMKAIPTSAVKFEHFVSGPLRESVADLLGNEAFDAVLRALQPVMASAVKLDYKGRRTLPHGQTPRVHYPRVLVLHRDERVGQRIATVLEPLTDRVLTAADGYVALGILMRHPPDLVVAEATLPSLPAAELIAEARAMHGEATPPIVLIGPTVPGAAAAVGDPVKPSELIAAVGNLP